MEKTNECARRRAQVDMIERYARIAGILLDSGTIEQSLPIADRQAYENEFRALNQRIDQALLSVRKTFTGVL